jgi:hypothetical protein
VTSKAAALIEIVIDDQCSRAWQCSLGAKVPLHACVFDAASLQSRILSHKIYTASAIIMRGPGSRPSLLFKLVVPATAIFAITVLALIAVVFSDPRAPVAQFLDRHGDTLLLAEFVVVIVLSLLAMTVDRIQTLRSTNGDSEKNSITGETDIRGES